MFRIKFRRKPWLPDPSTWKGTWREDWRIMGQEGYLTGKTLRFKPSGMEVETGPGEFSQCNFCYADIKKEDVAFWEPTSQVWICEKCHGDFSAFFDWSIVEEK